MKTIFLIIGLLINAYLHSQSMLSENFERLLKGELIEGKESKIIVNQCLKKPSYLPNCPFCDCNSLDSLVKLLKAVPKYNVEIITHTDIRGTYKKNVELSDATAKTIKSYLIASKIDSLRIKCTGMGEKEPYVFNNDSIVKNVNIKKGTIINEKFIKTLSNREMKEYFYSLNRRILVKFTYQ